MLLYQHDIIFLIRVRRTRKKIRKQLYRDCYFSRFLKKLFCNPFIDIVYFYRVIFVQSVKEICQKTYGDQSVLYCAVLKPINFRVRFFKKIQHWVLKFERIRKRILRFNLRFAFCAARSIQDHSIIVRHAKEPHM